MNQCLLLHQTHADASWMPVSLSLSLHLEFSLLLTHSHVYPCRVNSKRLCNQQKRRSLTSDANGQALRSVFFLESESSKASEALTMTARCYHHLPIRVWMDQGRASAAQSAGMACHALFFLFVQRLPDESGDAVY